eukprot:6485984-Amphidinium_carterae.1
MSCDGPWSSPSSWTHGCRQGEILGFSHHTPPMSLTAREHFYQGVGLLALSFPSVICQRHKCLCIDCCLTLHSRLAVAWLSTQYSRRVTFCHFGSSRRVIRRPQAF